MILIDFDHVNIFNFIGHFWKKQIEMEGNGRLIRQISRPQRPL